MNRTQKDLLLILLMNSPLAIKTGGHRKAYILPFKTA